MDHWGDPWADADHSTSTPTRDQVTAPVESPPPALPNAPTLLNGFLDDAQWGDSVDDGDFGSWTSSPNVVTAQTAVETESGLQEEEATVPNIGSVPTEDDVPRSDNDIHGSSEGAFGLEDEGWGTMEFAGDESRDIDNGFSEASDSTTTVQPDGSPERSSRDFVDALNPEDDLSTRPSTSPSDVSHTEPPSESPRTSFEDERSAKVLVPEEDSNQQTSTESSKSHTSSLRVSQVALTGSQNGHLLVTQAQEPEQEAEMPVEGDGEDADISHLPDSRNSKDADVDVQTESPAVSTLVNIPGLNIEPSLLSELFPPIKNPGSLSTSPDDPVYSTSSRKAWYRLTRKQTMREFNHGNDDDNYIRVTWKDSHIRSEVNKIVRRWATEERYSGRGPGAGANFFWDQTPRTDSKVAATHSRKKSSVSTSSPIQAAKIPVPGISTNVPVAFNWSTSPVVTAVASKPQKQDHSDFSSVVPSSNADIGAAPRVLHRPSHSISRHQSMESAQEPRIDTQSGSIPKTAPVLNQPTQLPADGTPWAGLGPLDTNTSAHPSAQAPFQQPKYPGTSMTAEDDEDDWGEMVQSPTLTVSTPVEPFCQQSSRNATLSTPSSTPQSVKTSPFQPPTTSKHASPIVRLKGTVSPTTALFRYNAFVPDNLEEGPIGPGLLKPALNKTSTPENATIADSPLDPKNASEEPTTTLTNDVTDTSVSLETKPIPSADTSAQRAEQESPDSAVTQSPLEPYDSTTTRAPEPANDPWSDADFSFFESTPPAQQDLVHDPSDPLSAFTNSEAPAPFFRPVAKAATPPPIQPLTGATNSAQRRKAEEDNTIRLIIEGLPDLTYMLQR